MAFGWHTRSNKTYMLANMLGACIYYMAVSWHTCSDKHILLCQLKHLSMHILHAVGWNLQWQNIYVVSQHPWSADIFHGCWLATQRDKTYMSVDMLGAHIYCMAVSWHAKVGCTYSRGNTLGSMHILLPTFWLACLRHSNIAARILFNLMSAWLTYGPSLKHASQVV